jgi:hypothetical protein
VFWNKGKTSFFSPLNADTDQFGNIQCLVEVEEMEIKMEWEEERKDI